MDLSVAGVGESGSSLVGSPGRRHVTALGVGGQEENRTVAACRQHHRIAGVAAHLACHEIADDDPARPPIDDHEVEHLGAWMALHPTRGDLTAQGGVGAEQQLLPGLAAAVEGARHLSAAKGAILQLPAILAREGNALGDALVDDVHRHLGHAVDVGLARAEVAALDGVVEEAEDAVAVVLVVLGGVDAALGGDGMRAPRRVLEAERLDVVAQLGQRRGRRRAGEAGADDEDLVFALVGRVDQLHLEAMPLPLLGQAPDGTRGFELHERPLLPGVRGQESGVRKRRTPRLRVGLVF